MQTMISVVICSATPAKLAAVTRMYDTLLAGGPSEIIPIRDAGGLAEGYNRGLEQSHGEVVMFSHDDVEFLSHDFRSRLLAHLEQCDVLGVQGTALLRDGQLTGAGPPYAY